MHVFLLVPQFLFIVMIIINHHPLSLSALLTTDCEAHL